jgi:hypothetical protein
MRKYCKTILGISILAIVLGTSSCFDILEEYHFNPDGSGSSRMIADVSQMMDLVSAFGTALDSTESGDVETLKEMFDESTTLALLKNIPGITNVRNLNSKEEKRVGYSFDFQDMDALNKALEARGSDMGLGAAMNMNGGGEVERENRFALDGKKLSRKLDMKMDPSKSGEEEGAQYAEMAMMMFQEAKYRTEYTFDRPVKNIKGNEAALIGSDRKSVTLEHNFKDLLEGKATMDLDIRLK